MTMTLQTETRPETAEAAPSTPTRTRRRTLAVRVGLTGIVAAVALGAVGTTMRNDANYAKDYVARQLGEQRITFKAADALNEDERSRPCLVANAGLPLTTGPQAECYANNFIGVHLKNIAGGKTFSEMRVVQEKLRADIAAAQAASDPAVADLQRQLGAATGQRQTLFEGETVRGLLLTSFGFSELGRKADLAANLAFAGVAAGLLLAAGAVVMAVASRRRTS